MGSFKNSKLLHYATRNFCVKVKSKVIPDENVLKNIENNIYRPKTHPGIFKPRAMPLPESFIKAVNNVIEDHPIKALIEDGKVLINHLRDKRPPLEPEEMKKIKSNIYERVIATTKAPQLETEEQQIKFQQTVNGKVEFILKREAYNWRPINYDTYNSLIYLVSRSPAEYAVLAKIFLEIAQKDPDFKPRSLFDFGSGVGTATWAANLYWKKHIFEYFNIDASSDMNDLAQILLQGGRGTNKMELKGVFYRQFLPATNITYDLVVSAYTLLELPSRQSRLNTILNLWNKTNKYLVLVEQGSSYGFEVINEIRDYILHTRNEANVGYVFSPCPHDEICPRFTADDGTPCNFEAFYFDFPIGTTSLRKQERYCYVVLKKGKRDPSDPQWPRIVRETLVRPKHTICRMCTKNANLQEIIFTSKKHGKNLYHCARASKWGDLVPITVQKTSQNEESQNSAKEETED